MPSLLRRHFTCFYCGERSSQKQIGHIRKWKCEHCEAVNYLDESGRITDPPASVTSSNSLKYAHPAPRAISPELHSPNDTLFCKTCLTNQQFLIKALNEYLPAPDDPQYAAYVKAEESYRRNLEARYPQVCADCAPRVQERIRTAGYAARADHLGRMLERTKHSTTTKCGNATIWKHMAISLAGLAWWTSLSVQLGWDIFGSLIEINEHDTWSLDATELTACLETAFQNYSVESSCVASSTSLAKTALLVGVLSLWWNNKWSAKLYGASGHLVGLKEHLGLQLLMLMVRAFDIYFLQDPSTLGLTMVAFKASHTFMLIFLFITALLSLRVVRVDRKPLVNFNRPIEPIVAGPSKHVMQPESTINYIERFPIKKLAPIPTPEISSPTNTPFSSYAADPRTTPPEYLPEDAMDWTPTRPDMFTLQSRKQVQDQTSKQQEGQFPHLPAALDRSAQSPFYGHLPPAPIPPAHKIRSPAVQPNFTAASPTQQKDFFNNILSHMRKGYGDKDSDNSNTTSLTPFVPKSSNRAYELAEGKLHIKEESVDTGLEAMFDSVFNMKDEPEEVSKISTSKSRSHGDLNHQTSNKARIGWFLLFGAASIGLVSILSVKVLY